MQINELFDSQAQFKRKINGESYTYSFIVDKVTFEATLDPNVFFDQKVTMFAFMRKHRGEWLYSWDSAPNVNQFKVYSTVFACLKDYIKARSPNMILFDGATERQHSFYQNENFKKFLKPLGYHIEVIEYENEEESWHSDGEPEEVIAIIKTKKKRSK
jgi:hypothetical protein